MLCSLAFVVAALAVTANASPVTSSGATRALPNTRMVRRSPVPGEQKSVNVKEHVTAKCNMCDGGGFGFSSGQSSISAMYSEAHLSSFSSLSYGSGFVSNVFPPMGNAIAISSWSQGGSSLFALANSMFGYAQHLQASIQSSISITTQTLIVSFTNMVQSLSACVQQFQGLGSFSGGNTFISYYSHVIIAFQGFLMYVSGSIGAQIFIQACGGMWQQFVSIFATFVSLGQQWNFFGGSFLQQYGISTTAFQSFGINTFSSFSSASTIAVGTFGSVIGSSSLGGIPISSGYGSFSGSQSIQSSSSVSASSASSFSGVSAGSFRN